MVPWQIVSFDCVDSMPVESLSRGLDKVAIGHGEVEGDYNEGSGYQGQRAEEPIRVTVAYFVTPKGEVTEADMQQFTETFQQWDQKAIWGGSLVVNPDKPSPVVPPILPPYPPMPPVVLLGEQKTTKKD